MGFVLKTNCNMKPFTVFHFWEFQKQQQEDIAVSPQYWARAAASKVVEQQASPKISNFPFWFSQNQKTNSILRKGFEIENSLAVMSPLNSHNKGPYKRSFWFQHLCSPTTNKETNNSLSSYFKEIYLVSKCMSKRVADESAIGLPLSEVSNKRRGKCI